MCGLCNHLDLPQPVERFRKSVKVQVGTVDVLKAGSQLEQLVEDVVLDERSSAILKNELHVGGIANREAHVPEDTDVTNRHQLGLGSLNYQLGGSGSIKVDEELARILRRGLEMELPDPAVRIVRAGINKNELDCSKCSHNNPFSSTTCFVRCT